MRKKSDEKTLGKDLAIKVASIHAVTVLNTVLQVLVVWLSTKVSLFPGADTLQSITGTCAEIVAGLYGITLAGYTFFLSRIDGLMASDSTLSYIVASIKKRFKNLVWGITFNVLMTLCVSITLMYWPVPDKEELTFFYRLFCNEFILSVAVSFGLIMYYSLLVVDPNCIEKEAEKLKRRLCPVRGRDGSVTEFIAMYDRIEETCNQMIPPQVLRQLRENKGNPIEYSIALLGELRPDLKYILPEIERIHMYYECAVNCRKMRVSQVMCDRAEFALEQLNKKR